MTEISLNVTLNKQFNSTTPATSENRATRSNNKAPIRKPDEKTKHNSKDITTSNKFESLSDVDEDMDTTHHHRPSRSQSRSRSRSKNISPIKHR